jgi:hypothetical protein
MLELEAQNVGLRLPANAKRERERGTRRGGGPIIVAMQQVGERP